MARLLYRAPKLMSKSSVKPANTNPEIIFATLPVAGVLRRLAALVYDAFLLFGLLVAPLFIAIAVFGPHQQLAPEGAVTHELPSIAPRPLLLAYMIIVVAGFYCYFWRKSGQTLGMQAWRIRVDSCDGDSKDGNSSDGQRPSWIQCGLRCAVGIASLACFGLGYGWIWIDKHRASWHDRASNTRVVVLPKKFGDD